MGVPRVYCDCEVCTEARNTRNNRRLRSAVMVECDETSFMIDCGPDWRSMMEGLGKRKMSDMLITHAHFDHIGGLPEWSDACRWQRKRDGYTPLPRCWSKLSASIHGFRDRWR